MGRCMLVGRNIGHQSRQRIRPLRFQISNEDSGTSVKERLELE